jgi:hypothetical protein
LTGSAKKELQQIPIEKEEIGVSKFGISNNDNNTKMKKNTELVSQMKDLL